MEGDPSINPPLLFTPTKPVTQLMPVIFCEKLIICFARVSGQSKGCSACVPKEVRPARQREAVQGGGVLPAMDKKRGCSARKWNLFQARGIKRPVYTDDFCRAIQYNFCRAEVAT